MTVYIDDAVWPWRGRRWAHLMADSLDELHAFAAALGIPRRAFQNKRSGAHYDVPAELRAQALALGFAHGFPVLAQPLAHFPTLLRRQGRQSLAQAGAKLAPLFGCRGLQLLPQLMRLRFPTVGGQGTPGTRVRHRRHFGLHDTCPEQATQQGQTENHHRRQKDGHDSLTSQRGVSYAGGRTLHPLTAAARKGRPGRRVSRSQRTHPADAEPAENTMKLIPGLLAITTLLVAGGALAQSRLGLPASLTGLFPGLLLFPVLACDTLIAYRVRRKAAAKAAVLTTSSLQASTPLTAPVARTTEGAL